MSDNTSSHDCYDDELDERDVLRALDPDSDEVPLLDASLNHQQVFINGEPQVFVAAPASLHAHSRRLREGFYEDGGNQ